MTHGLTSISKTTDMRERFIEEVVGESCKMIGILVEETMSRVRVEMQVRICVHELLPNNVAVFRREEYIITSFKTSGSYIYGFCPKLTVCHQNWDAQLMQAIVGALPCFVWVLKGLHSHRLHLSKLDI